MRFNVHFRFRAPLTEKGAVSMANIRILSREDVIRVTEMQPIIDCVEEVYRQKSDGQTVVWPTTFYEFDPGHADMDIKSGYFP